jgi:hypothetical protein
MKKVQICPNCNTENPFYVLNCINCKAFLRSKIANIDLWDTLWKLLESPIKTAETIIHSEHKNFSSIILLLAGIKAGSSFLVVSNALDLFSSGITSPFRFIFICASIFIIALFAASFLITKSNQLFGIKNRVKDNIALYAYSFLPAVFIMIFLTPVKLAIFGLYWYSFNPSPMLFKPMTTNIMLFIEGIFYLWSIVLLITSTYAQTKNIFYSVLVGLGISFILLISIVFIGSYIYTVIP